ncbi:TRAP transporter small permease [Shimia aestuarii]|uniref:TRAP transporter small permease n=1 Tax=Shimia aestuarii TaxID=254406 RepID=UPI001FB316AB|nr:TRAP transporter small permease [Shimia aestuarii]
MYFAPRLEKRMGRVIDMLARVMAYGGGLVLLAISAMTVVSIIGRAGVGYGLQPVPGDYELVANGCALAVFSFLPYCQLKRGHVTVDILTDHFPARARALMGLLGDVLITLAALVILRQLWFGFAEKFPYGSDALREALSMGYKPFYPETTYELEIPVWIPYGFALLGATLFALVSLYTVWRSLNWCATGREDAV